MSEIIPINVGGFGTASGLNFLKQIASEHRVPSDTFEGKPTFFHETLSGSYENRAIFIDSDIKLYKSILNSKVPIKKQAFVTDVFSCKNNYYEGYTMPISFKDQVIESVRLQVQKCDKLSSFMVNHALGGGAGSGITAHLLQHLQEEYRNVQLQCYQLIPDWKTNIDQLSVINALLIGHKTLQNTDSVICFENQAYERMFKKSKQKIQSLPEFMGKALSRITHPYRFGGSINTNVRKKNVSLIPFPRLKYFAPGFSFDDDEKNPISSAFRTKNRMILKDARGIYYVMGSWVHVRGDPLMYESQVERTVKKQMRFLKSQFTQWIPFNIHFSNSNENDQTKRPSANVILNSKQNIHWMRQICEKFTLLYRRKAFTHLYTSLGLDLMEFSQAQSNLNDLYSQYAPYCCSCDIEEEMEYDDEDQYE